MVASPTMRPRRIIARPVVHGVLLCGVLVHSFRCDSGTQPTPITASDPYLEIRPLTQLLPGRPTHVAMNSVGNVYWVQETAGGDDGVIAMGTEGVPRATPLTTDGILAAMGAPAEDVSVAGAGNIHALAAGNDGEIYFYFSGGVNRRTFAALGRYEPRTGQIRLLADTATLALDSRMGLSLSLARGRILLRDHGLFLWLRHTDGSAVFALDTRQIPSTGPASLRRVLDAIAFDAAPVDLRRETATLSADSADSPDTLLLTDNAAGAIHRIDVKASTAVRVASLVGVPTRHSLPIGVGVPKGGVALFAAANVPIREADTLVDLEVPKVRAGFPALVLLTPQHAVTYGPEVMRPPTGFPAYAMDISELVPAEVPDVWLAHDAASGQLLRLRLKR